LFAVSFAGVVEVLHGEVDVLADAVVQLGAEFDEVVEFLEVAVEVAECVLFLLLFGCVRLRLAAAHIFNVCIILVITINDRINIGVIVHTVAFLLLAALILARTLHQIVSIHILTLFPNVIIIQVIYIYIKMIILRYITLFFLLLIVVGVRFIFALLLFELFPVIVVHFVFARTQVALVAVCIILFGVAVLNVFAFFAFFNFFVNVQI